MTISGISGAAGSYSPYGLQSSPQQSTFKALQNLAQALQSGDLSGAQSAFSTLTTLLTTAASNALATASPASSGGSPAGGSGASANPILTDLGTLAQALKSGSLTGAQSAFSQLEQDAAASGSGSTAVTPAGVTASGSTASGSSPLATDLQNLSQALQSGDLSGAQSAFAKLTQDAKASSGAPASGHSHHHHHHGGSGGGALSALVAALNQLSSTTSSSSATTGSTPTPSATVAAAATTAGTAAGSSANTGIGLYATA